MKIDYEKLLDTRNPDNNLGPAVVAVVVVFAIALTAIISSVRHF